GKMNRKPGDWDCRSCQHLNFSRRDLCQRCGEPRSAADRGSGSSFGTGFGAGSDVRPGDWYCTCGAHNFASRSSCFKCAAFKEEAAGWRHGSRRGRWSCQPPWLEVWRLDLHQVRVA
uniref:RanBP2-type domain-containing protein n=1 Tax=Aegilops tauschii subsp. strangulata TaxID=200361 RepID=A0A453NQ87_AEGTS